jgi:ElaB/YqjD/DUF883 family membrane-anchored ribosome-binding protein
MTIQNTTQKAADAAHKAADEMLDTASGAVQSTRKVANEALDKAESGMRRMQDSVDPLIDDLAAKAQELASRSINYCAQASDRARRRLNDATEATCRYVSDQPGKSLVLAAAAGAALTAALLLTRRRGGRY